MRWVYILRCCDGSLYVGQTQDVEQRVRTHNDGRGARFTSTRRPVALAYSEGYQTEIEAIARERQLKGWARRKKEALVAGDLVLLKKL